MTNLFIPKHPIQRHVLSVLVQQKYARFRDMRPLKCDTNLYSYHLKILQKQGLVTRAENGYTLGRDGLVYAHRLEHEGNVGSEPAQPSVMVMMVIQNSNGDVLLRRRNNQPFIDTWTLPDDVVGGDDTSLEVTVGRIAADALQIKAVSARHAGDCYVRVHAEAGIVTSQFVHVFRFETDSIALNDNLVWARPHKLGQYELAPGVEQIITRAFFNDPHFFEEFAVELSP